MARFVCAVLLAVAAIATGMPLASDKPTQIHINQGNANGTAMTVTWMTTSATTGVVFYGTTTDLGSKADQEAPAQSYTFVSAYSGSYTSGLIHHTTIENLKPDTVYYYSCGTPSDMSRVYSFRTPPPVGPTSTIVLNLVGDLGQTKDSASTLQHIQEDTTAHMTLLIGDLSYADSAEKTSEGHNCTQRRWDSWGELIEPTFANQPLMVLAGNHEVEQEGPAPATQEPFVAFQARFKMPFADCSGDNGNLYYSFKAGPMHVIMLNSYMDFSAGSPQHAWFTAELAKVDRDVTPWLSVNMHAPWYNSDVHHHDEPEEMGMRALYEPLFRAAQVDVVFAGHVHAYERMYPVYNNVTTPGATTFINIGDGGNREGPATGYYAQPAWSAYREPAFGHGRLEVFNATHAHWEWHKNSNGEAKVSDDVWLVRNTALGNGLQTGVSAIGGMVFDGYRK